MERSSVLLLDSDEFSVAHLSQILFQANYEVILVHSLREAFQKIKTLARDLVLVILDFDLATDDIDILERQRKLEFDRPLPVVLMGQVDLSEQEIGQLCEDSGYAGYLYKKMSAPEILAKISEITEKTSYP